MKKHFYLLIILALSFVFIEEVRSQERNDQLKDIPVNVQKWIQTELNKAKNKTSLSKEDFFCKDSAKLIGYIKGYDATNVLTRGVYNVESEVTGEGYPKNVEIYPDGRFEVTIPMEHSSYTYFSLKKESIPFYIEPGQTLAMILDWSEFLFADLQKSFYEFENVVFMGSSAKINADLTKYKQKEVFHSDGATMANRLTPAEFKSRQKQALTNYLDKLDKANQEAPFSPKAFELLKNKFLLSYANSLFEYVKFRNMDASPFFLKLKTTAPLSYYDFLKEIPLDDQNLLISYEFLEFIRNFEYCEPLRNGPFYVISDHKQKSFFAYLIEDEKIKLSADEMALKLWADTTGITIETPENKAFFDEKFHQIEIFDEKYKKYDEVYKEKTNRPTPTGVDFDIECCLKKDSILINDLKLTQSLAYEITKIRQFAAQLKKYDKTDAVHYYEKMIQAITIPYLRQEGERILKLSFKVPSVLPPGKGTDVFRNIIDIHKGKFLFVDFWATSCVPCVRNIKDMKAIREKYKDNKDFEFIFITDDGGSPIKSYNEFVEDQHLIHSYRLSTNEIRSLYNLFRINSIPHYVVIDREGKVINDNFKLALSENELDRILKNY